MVIPQPYMPTLLLLLDSYFYGITNNTVLVTPINTRIVSE